MGNKNYLNPVRIEELITKGKLAYSINEAAFRCGCSPNHLRNENRRGKLRFVKLGKLTRILDSDLRAYLESQVVETAA
jgi:excisionase family DNA binding protein